MTGIYIATFALALISVVLLLILLLRKPTQQDAGVQTNDTMATLGGMVAENLRDSRQAQNETLSTMDQNLQDKLRTMNEQLERLEKRLYAFTESTTQNMENIRGTVDKNLTSMQSDNNKKLDEMRGIVDEKLQKTLNERMNESFRLVNDRLEQVYKGLGEMQTLAQGVGDLKKVLTNVKTRGIVGEIQLGAILEEILAPEQYDVNVVTKAGSRNVVEYAIKIPVEDSGFIYLPIDSKFPGDTYANLCDAYDTGDKVRIEACVKLLMGTIKSEAKDIRDKYLDPPNTTDFALLFLPFEGLYAEVVNRGMVEVLQREYHVNIAGPSTMAAMLNSLQMSFRAVAIQKRSGEVWTVLGAVKTEFEKFETVLSATQQRLDQASKELDKLVGTRTRAIRRKLNTVTELDDKQSQAVLDLSEEAEGE